VREAEQRDEEEGAKEEERALIDLIAEEKPIEEVGEEESRRNGKGTEAHIEHPEGDLAEVDLFVAMAHLTSYRWSLGARRVISSRYRSSVGMARKPRPRRRRSVRRPPSPARAMITTGE
jgi:hypothetical protein